MSYIVTVESMNYDIDTKEKRIVTEEKKILSCDSYDELIDNINNFLDYCKAKEAKDNKEGILYKNTSYKLHYNNDKLVQIKMITKAVIVDSRIKKNHPMLCSIYETNRLIIIYRIIECHD